MLQRGARWRDCPRDYGPYTTISIVSIAGPSAAIGGRSLKRSPCCYKDGMTLSIDSTSIKAHRSASSGKCGSLNRRSAARAVARAERPRLQTLGTSAFRKLVRIAIPLR